MLQVGEAPRYRAFAEATFPSQRCYEEPAPVVRFFVVSGVGDRDRDRPLRVPEVAIEDELYEINAHVGPAARARPSRRSPHSAARRQSLPPHDAGRTDHRGSACRWISARARSTGGAHPDALATQTVQQAAAQSCVGVIAPPSRRRQRWSAGAHRRAADGPARVAARRRIVREARRPSFDGGRTFYQVANVADVPAHRASTEADGSGIFAIAYALPPRRPTDGVDRQHSGQASESDFGSSVAFAILRSSSCPRKHYRTMQMTVGKSLVVLLQKLLRRASRLLT